MAAELQVLALSALLWVALLLVTAIGVNRQLGPSYLMGPRDAPPAPLEGTAARLKRAFDNHTEGLVPFTAAVVVVHLADAASVFTAACAWAYLAARVLYVPAYALGWTPGRSLIWGVGFAATALLLLLGLIATLG
ncbi:MAG: MAPEG family protein [Geminicoccaceae bacterium]|nr:MAG: MAPEG family protein [Geminicoccaceae bacterium]